MGLMVDVSFSYGERRVLRNVRFGAERGELLAIIGPNGAGKSTLLKCIVGILRPKGRVLLDGMDVLGMKPRIRARHIAYVPQSSVPEYNFTVEEFVEMGTYMTRGDVKSALKKVGLLNRAGDSIFSLSGGEYQLALIARALAQGSRAILLDEPTAHLDVNRALEVMEILSSLKMEKIVVTVLHDLNLAVRYADRVVVLKNGEKFWEGEIGELSPEILEKVYGIRAEIMETTLGRVFVASL